MRASAKEYMVDKIIRYCRVGIANACMLALMLVPLLARAELARAELIVIYDSGKTEPIAPLLTAFDTVNDSPQQSPLPGKSPLGAAKPQTWLPLQSPGLTPGPVQTRTQDRPFARPFFLIGSDNLSRQWLQRNHARLKEIGAVGMLVQADNLDDLRVIADLANGLSVIPASASDIAQALGISHYPVLISAHLIEQ